MAKTKARSPQAYDALRELIAIHSPSGYTQLACRYIFDLLADYGYAPEYTNKGSVRCRLGADACLAFAAHTDTLGAIVSNIGVNGTLQISQLGGWPLNSFEGEYVEVKTLAGATYTGTFLLNNPSAHVNRNVGTSERRLENMHIRLDEEVENAADVGKLGIRVGDIVCFEQRYQELASGYIKSRFLDNKAGCYVLFEVARRLAEQGKNPPVELLFSTYEEVGHGCAPGFSDGVEELVVVDMGVVGDGCQGRETCCSICAKDSSGPYDYELRRRLVLLAEQKKIPFRLDIYPFYGSDGSAALRAGHDLRVALIGPGVAASHGIERTHKKGIAATIDLCLAYIENQREEPL